MTTEDYDPLYPLRSRCEEIAAYLKHTKLNIPIGQATAEVDGMFDDRSEEGLGQYLRAYAYLVLINKNFKN
jgi:hypothetical protein